MQKYDYLVIGSGIAGLVFAIEVAEYGTVAVLSKDQATEGSTRYAQGGIASVTSPLDSFESHIEDTIGAGDGLCQQDVVQLVVGDGPKAIQRLIQLGTEFDKDEDTDNYELAREGGHSARRILHAKGDATGAEIQRAIYENARTHKNIKLLPRHTAIDFICSKRASGKEVEGAYVLNRENSEIEAFIAKSTLIAAGGTGKVYLYTSNPNVSTGDGIAMAYRAGAEVANMEFIQFHPTCLYHSAMRTFLITEAMRGEGAKLLTLEGKSFMQLYDERAELAPRDVVARAIDEQMKKTGATNVLLDISDRDSDFVKNRFPMIYKTLLDVGIDITKQAIPVVPAAHYCCGGIVSDEHGRTNLTRLYVSGEAAFTGLHGANRLASNSLLEAIVFSMRAAKAAVESQKKVQISNEITDWDDLETTHSEEEVIVSHLWDEVRRTMWNLVGIVRSDKRLSLAKRRIRQIKEEAKDYYWNYKVTNNMLELRNIIEVAELIINSAITRKESRGLHYNSDYPYKNETDFKKNTVLKRSDEAKVTY